MQLSMFDINDNDSIKGTYKFIDLFAGVGGFRLAFDNLKQKCVFSSEIDNSCRKVYEKNFGVAPSGDIKKIEAKDIPDFDILTGGFPCQPFSYAGKKEGFADQTRGTLFFDILRILKEKQPEMLLLENVKGLVSHNKGETLKIIESELRALGYNIFWKVLDSNNYGLPQHRQRWYCVGFKNQNIKFSFPEPTDTSKKLKDIVDINLKDESLNLTQFEIERINHHFASDEIRVKHDNSKYAPNTKKGKYGIYSYLKPDGTLRFHVGDKAKTQIQEAYYCCLNSVAPTIIASREPKMWDLKRRLSVNECKKLQGFPDDFDFCVSNLQAKKELGNAVSVPVIQIIAKQMILAYEKYGGIK